MTEKAIDRVLEHLSLKDTPVEEAGRNCVKNLYRMFLATDATQLEVNPLAETPEGNSKLYCHPNALRGSSSDSSPSRSFIPFQFWFAMPR